MKRLRSSSRLRTIFIVSVPVLLGILELYHPPIAPGTPIYETIAPIVRWWIALHVMQLVLVVLLAASVVLLTINVRGAAVSVVRWSMAIFAILYPAFDSAVGISSGVIVANAGRLTPEGQNALESAFQALFFGPTTGTLYLIAAAAWFVGVVATAAVVRAHGAHWVAVVLLIAAALSFAVSHVRPFGPVGCFCFAIGAAVAQLSARQEVYVRIRKRPLLFRR